MCENIIIILFFSFETFYRQLISWRRKLRAELYPREKEAEEKELSIAEIPAEEEEEEEEEDLELSELKRKKKKILKERKKLNERMSLGIVTNDNELREEDDMELFTLRKIKNRSELDRFQEAFIDELDDQLPNKLEPDDDDDIESRPKKVYFDRHAKDDYDFEDNHRNPNEVDSEEEEDEKDNINSDDENGEQDKDENMEEDEQEEEEGGGLLVELDDRPTSEKDKVFFERGIFNEDEWEDDDDVAAMAIDARKLRQQERKAEKKALKDAKKKDKKMTKEMIKEMTTSTGTKGKKRVRFAEDSDEEAIDGGESDDESEEDLLDKAEKTPTLDERCKSNVKLSPEELALGSVMITSAKTRREIIDQAWNRYMNADHDFVPSWFKKDEDIFFHKPLPVPEATVREFKKKLKQINARPIKKVAEANARKRKRAQRKMERARKKAEALTDIPDMSEKEKMATIRK